MRKVVLLMLVVWLVGIRIPVQARGGDGGGAWSVWLWNYEQGRLIKVALYGAGEPTEIPLNLPEGYQISGVTATADATKLAVCLKPENSVGDMMVGLYDPREDTFVVEPRSIGGVIICTAQSSTFDLSNSYFVFSVMTAPPSDEARAQWDVQVMDANSGEIVYSISDKQADPNGSVSILPMVISADVNSVRLLMTPFASEIASEINLVEWKLGEDHVNLLDSYPFAGLNMLPNGDAVYLASSDNSDTYDTVMYQSMDGTPYPIYSYPGTNFWNAFFIDSGRKVIANGVDAEGVAHIFMIDRTIGAVELNYGATGSLVPTPMGYLALGASEDSVFEVQSIQFTKQGEIEDPTLLWSDATSNAWIVMAYPPIQLPDTLPPFQEVSE
jgi:hypothetical protein